MVKEIMWKTIATIAMSVMPCIYAYKGIMLEWWQWFFLLAFYYMIWIEVKE